VGGVNPTVLAARGAAVIVAAVAGAASFEHIASVAIAAGERPWVGYALPAAIDGLIVVGVAALLEDKRHHRHGRRSARLAVLVGVIATLAANLASAQPTVTARLVAITAPVSFLLAVEVLTRTGRPLSTPDDNTSQPAAAGATRTRKGSAGARRRPTAAERVTRAVAKTPHDSPAQIAARLHVSERTVQRYWPHHPTSPPPGNGAVPAGPPATVATRAGGVAPVPPAAFDRTAQRSRPDPAAVST
jgi:Ca2+/Na+ antiporter